MRSKRTASFMPGYGVVEVDRLQKTGTLGGFSHRKTKACRGGRLDSARFWCCLFALTGMLGLGCAGGFKHAPVNARTGRETLRTALESWRKGEKVNMLKTGDPPIYVIDMDWQAGVRLKDYQIVNDGDAKDAHLFCPVKLTLQFSGGKEVKMQVTYIIATAPNLTVSRKVL